MSYAPQMLNAFLLTVVFVILLQGVAQRTGLLDRPGGRKQHEGAIPLIGGLAMFPAFVVASLWLEPDARAPWTVMAGLGVLVAMGACDDRFGLRAASRLAIQIGAALLIVWHVAPSVVWLRDAPLGALAIPLGVIFVVGLANAFNMADGIDGVAGGMGAVALFWLALAAMAAGRAGAMIATLPLMFAALGFLVFNLRHRWRRKASAFMGDAGSMMLGGAVAYFSLALAAGENSPGPMTALLWISALPAIETLSLIVRRLRAGRSPMSGDRRHLHHILVDAGVPPARAAAALIAASAGLGGVGFGAATLGASDATLALGLGLVVAAHGLAVAKIHALLRLRAARPAEPELSMRPASQLERQNA